LLFLSFQSIPKDDITKEFSLLLNLNPFVQAGTAAAGTAAAKKVLKHSVFFVRRHRRCFYQFYSIFM
jgi:hypothetical protein